MAGAVGIEPTPSALETLVLPLYYAPVTQKSLQILTSATKKSNVKNQSNTISKTNMVVVSPSKYRVSS